MYSWASIVWLWTGFWANGSHCCVQCCSVTFQTFVGALLRHTEVTMAAYVHQWPINLVCFDNYLFVSIQLNTHILVMWLTSYNKPFPCGFLLLHIYGFSYFHTFFIIVLWTEFNNTVNCFLTFSNKIKELTELSPSITLMSGLLKDRGTGKHYLCIHK